MRSLYADLSFALRLLVKAPAVSLTAVLTLAVGIGASTTVFGVVNRLLLRAVPFSSPHELVVVWQTWARKGLPQLPVLPADYVEWEREAGVFSSIAAFENVELNLTGVPDPEHLRGTRASAAFFTVLGVEPALGRAFRLDEDAPGRSNVIVLSDRFWRRRFDADPAIVGTSVYIDGAARTVVGVMPPDFRFSMEWSMAGLSFPATDCWIPLALTGAHMLSGHDLIVLGRLRPGATLQQAQSVFETIAQRQEQEHPARSAGVGASVVPLRELLVSDVRPFLVALLGAVGFVLLVACANVANLVLAHSVARRNEFAVRVALGAGRLRILRQLIAEGLLFGALGGLLGLVFAVWANGILSEFGPSTLARSGELRIDATVVVFGAVLWLAVALFLSLVSFLQVWSIESGASLKDESRGASFAPRVRSLRGILVIAEIAVTVTLLAGAGLMTRNLLRLFTRDPGFTAAGVLAVQVPLSPLRYAEGTRQADFFRRLIALVEAAPGASDVAVTSYVPTVQSSEIFFTVDGRPVSAAEDVPMGSARSVSPAYFRAMAIPIEDGRAFTEWDNADRPGVVMVDDVAARLYWPGERPVGKRLKRGGPQSTAPWLTVVGVAGAVRQYGPETEAKPGLYFPYEQVPRQEMAVVVRSTGDPRLFIETVRRAVRGLDADQPIGDARTMEDLLAGMLSVQRFAAGLLVAFALVALGLSAAGTYAVVAYSVGQRRRELGIRVAVGALPASLFRLVFADGARLLAWGLLLGSAGSLVIGRLLATVLPDARGVDAATLASVNVLLGVVTAAACYGPARRATRVDPIVMLRQQ